MNLKEIKDLIEFFDKSEIARLKIKQDNFEIHLDKNIASINPATAVTPTIAQPANIAITTQESPESNAPLNTSAQNNTSSSNDFILSPMVGTFYHCPSPGAAPYVQVGDTIKKGQTIGIVEAMKIMNEIEAEYDCKIISIEVSDGQPVEFGSKLIKVEKL